MQNPTVGDKKNYACPNFNFTGSADSLGICDFYQLLPFHDIGLTRVATYMDMQALPTQELHTYFFAIFILYCSCESDKLCMATV
jgi:hypothetical protein